VSLGTPEAERKAFNLVDRNKQEHIDELVIWQN
jgi:hypothetical protein